MYTLNGQIQSGLIRLYPNLLNSLSLSFYFPFFLSVSHDAEAFNVAEARELFCRISFHLLVFPRAFRWNYDEKLYYILVVNRKKYNKQNINRLVKKRVAYVLQHLKTIKG